MPLVHASRRMADLAPGETLVVLTTDPEAPIDLAAWAAEEGHGFRPLGGRQSGDDPTERWLELELRKGG